MSDVQAAREVNPLRLFASDILVRKRGQKSYVMRCPFHPDDKPSMSLRWVPQANAWLWKCFGCQAAGDGIALARELFSMSMDDAVSVLLGRGKVPVVHGKRVVAEYDYWYKDGSHAYQVVRYEPKDFRVRHKTEDGWKWGRGTERRVLYRLPVLLESPPHRPIWFVEGEKDVETLLKIGLVATTTDGGASAFRAELLNDLPQGRRSVIVCPDNDDVGKQYMRRVYASARDGGWDVDFLLLPGEYRDASDYLAKCDPGVFLEKDKKNATG